MLGTKTYTGEYINACRARVERDIAANRASGAKTDAFETSFFNNMVLLLDYFFVHRLRTLEGKDGNALNEVRILCNSLLNNGGVMTAENVSGMMAFAGLQNLRLSPEKSVLKYSAGDEVRLSEANFVALSEAFFGEIERKYFDLNASGDPQPAEHIGLTSH